MGNQLHAGVRPLSGRLAALAMAFGVWSATASAQDVATQIQYLSGKDGFNTVNWNFSLSSGRGSGVATTIAVPSQIEMQGFGAYAYNANYANTGTAQYAYNFNVSPDWTGKRIYIVFEGAGRDVTVFINGQQVGPTHQGSFYRFTYDITSFISVGASNLLQVTVLPNDPVLTGEWGDYWSYWGISRPVYLEAFPPQFVERVAINARADGSFAMDAYINGVTTATSILGADTEARRGRRWVQPSPHSDRARATPRRKP